MIKSTCIYIKNSDSILMLLRNKKQNDLNEGKWIGIGGKLEKDELPLDCAVREIYEEVGIHFSKEKLIFHGIVNFYVDHFLEERIWLYSIPVDEQFEIDQCNEGTLVWIPKSKVLDLNLWDGDRVFLTHMSEDSSPQYLYDFYYDKDGSLLRHIERVYDYE